MKKAVSIFVLIIFGISGLNNASARYRKDDLNIKCKSNHTITLTSEVKRTTIMESMINVKESDPILKMVENIQWYGQASVRIKGANKVIYVDPYLLTDNEVADYIFITHSHGDHFSIEDIKKIANNYTKIYAPKDCCDKLRGQGLVNCIVVTPEESLKMEGVRVKVVPAYNIAKNFHAREKKFVGYVITLDGVKIYHPGDTEQIPEMKDIQCDIAFMPLGQTYTMQNVQEAANAVLDVKAKYAIPIHFGLYEGAATDAQLFKDLLKDKVIVVIKECKNPLQR